MRVNSKDNKLFKTKNKKKSETKLAVADRTCMFSLQEYQHVHLLWFKKRSFTLVWKPNPPLRSIRCAHLRAHADAANESTMGARCSRSALRAASALPLLCLRMRCETGVNQALLKLALKAPNQWNLSPATMCHGFGAAQTMHSHKCDHVKFLLAHSQKMFGRSLEPCFVSNDRKISKQNNWQIEVC